ncbi:MAG: hypothetical protein M1508_09720 [Nitrospirae bacterium]|nr:hypothetical protein [Nitrospirota bacterium]MCL5422198.1 hypothetical protein [Nitrospirota bacterium]
MKRKITVTGFCMILALLLGGCVMPFPGPSIGPFIKLDSSDPQMVKQQEGDLALHVEYGRVKKCEKAFDQKRHEVCCVGHQES